MDDDIRQFEERLKELTPKSPSDGARWNLAQRLADMEDLEGKKPTATRPLRLILMSAAASILVVVIALAVISSSTSPDNEPGIASQPTPTDSGQPLIADTPDAPPAAGQPVGPELIGEENDVPSVIRTKKYFTGTEEMGVVRLPDRPPMRRVKRDFIDEVHVRDPETGEVYRIQKPGSETIYIKMKDY